MTSIIQVNYSWILKTFAVEASQSRTVTIVSVKKLETTIFLILAHNKGKS